MGLNSKIRQATAKGFRANKSQLVACTYMEMGEPVYDVETGTDSTPTTEHAIRAMKTSFKEEDIDDNAVHRGDQRITVEAKRVSFEPSLHDQISCPDGVWEVIRSKREMSGSVLIIQVRRP